jgi:pimeloyl-ACP methyl ester carboxylesterase
MKLFCRIYGSGPVLMILHGLYGSSDNWVTIARKVSEKFTVILPDLRNHGQSPHSAHHSYDLMAEDILELADWQKADRFILAGHSMGGKAAMKFALRWPERLNSLVVADITPFGSRSPETTYYTEHRKILETIISTDPRKFASRKELEESLKTGIPSEKIRGFIMKNLGRNEKGSFEWKLNAPSLLENLGNITDGILGEGDDKVQVTGFPVTFLRGENSKYIDLNDSGRIRELFPAADIITIKDAGHWLHADRPDAVEETLLAQG